MPGCEMYAQLPGVKPMDVPDGRLLLKENTHRSISGNLTPTNKIAGTLTASSSAACLPHIHVNDVTVSTNELSNRAGRSAIRSKGNLVMRWLMMVAKPSAS